MLLEIQHRTHYTYDQIVHLEPQHFYFLPLQRSYFKTLEFRLTSNPLPRLQSQRIDLENNAYFQCWYDQALTRLEIEVSMRLETNSFNPFDFLEESGTPLPTDLAQSPFLIDSDIAKPLEDWARQFAESTGKSISFLTAICAAIHEEWNHQARYDETLMSPEACFEKKEGSCRDLSWMLIVMLRRLNFPARFVSGYSFNPELGDGHELHAWVEVFVQGGGWIGLDPSSGLLTTDSYIPVATSHTPSHTLPVQGTFRGNAQSTLETSVEITIH